MRRKKFTKERFYKRLATRKLKAMLRIEQGIKLAKEVINTEQELKQAIQSLDMDLAVQLTIKQMNLHNQVKLLMAYRV